MIRLPTPTAGENAAVGDIEYAERRQAVAEQEQATNDFLVDQQDRTIGVGKANQKRSAERCQIYKETRKTIESAEAYRSSRSQLAVLSILFLTCCSIAVIKLAHHPTGVGYVVAARNITNATLKAIGDTGRATFNATNATSGEIHLYPKYTLKLSDVQKKGICDDGVDPTWEFEHEAELGGHGEPGASIADVHFLSC